MVANKADIWGAAFALRNPAFTLRGHQELGVERGGD